MRRRRFLVIVAGLSAAGVAAWVGAKRSRVRRVGQELRRIEGLGRLPATRLRSHYSWLNVDPAAFDRYMADYQRAFGPLGRFDVLDDRFFTRFLLSTDFYAGGVERPRDGGQVRYTALYDPDSSPCDNPLALPPPSDADLGRKSPRAI